MSALKRSVSEEDFWQSVETLIGEICPFTKNLLSQCRYNNYASFRGLHEDELQEVFNELESHIKALNVGSAEHELLYKLVVSYGLQANYRLKMNVKSSIRAIFELIQETPYKDFISQGQQKLDSALDSAGRNVFISDSANRQKKARRLDIESGWSP